MISIKAEKRKDFGRKVVNLRDEGILPGVLYGPKVENMSIQLDLKDFSKLYKVAGESTLISLEVGEKKFSVLIHDIKKDPITEDPIHVDFYQPILTEKVEATVPIIFEGEPLAVKELGGTLVKEIQEVVVKALPQDLPHDIKVDVSGMETFDDEILIKDLKVADNVTIQKEPDEVVAVVTPPQKEEELEKPAEPVDAEGSGEVKENEDGDEEAKEKELEEEKKNEE